MNNKAKPCTYVQRSKKKSILCKLHEGCMKVFSSFGGDKHEFCLVVIKFKHVRSCQSFLISYA